MKSKILLASSFNVNFQFVAQVHLHLPTHQEDLDFRFKKNSLSMSGYLAIPQKPQSYGDGMDVRVQEALSRGWKTCIAKAGVRTSELGMHLSGVARCLSLAETGLGRSERWIQTLTKKLMQVMTTHKVPQNRGDWAESE